MEKGGYIEDYNFEDEQQRRLDLRQKRGFDREKRSASFKCGHCKTAVSSASNESVGTEHRDHCPCCLWSKHVDNKPGDRKSECLGGMEPIGMTLKKEKGELQGEPMVVYECKECGVVHKNRCAADDSNIAILDVYFNSLKNKEISEKESPLSNKLDEAGITILGKDESLLLLTRLFGKGNIPEEYLKKVQTFNETL